MLTYWKYFMFFNLQYIIFKVLYFLFSFLDLFFAIYILSFLVPFTYCTTFSIIIHIIEHSNFEFLNILKEWWIIYYVSKFECINLSWIASEDLSHIYVYLFEITIAFYSPFISLRLAFFCISVYCYIFVISFRLKKKKERFTSVVLVFVWILRCYIIYAASMFLLKILQHLWVAESLMNQ